MKIHRYIILGLFLYCCNKQAYRQNGVKTITSEYIESVDPVNENLFSETLKLVKEQEIEEVYYGIVNYQERPYRFDGFHLCDQAVIIKLSNGKWLNWVWVEEGFYKTSDINITTKDIRNKLNDKFTKIENVSESIEWKKLIGRKIDSIQFKIIDIKGTKHISDIRLTFKNDHVSICAIEEPDPYKLPILDSLPYSANWTIVVFDDKILKKYHRIIE